ncbi:MAG: hypothetical protein U0270_25455 [Labilithrix sp.]
MNARLRGIARSRVALLAASLLVATSPLACERRESLVDAAAPATSVSAPLASSSSTASAAPASSTPERPVLATEGCGAIMPLALRSAKSIGHTSVVFKLELETGQKLAWKPSSKRGKDRWRGEVAAAKLGDALSISNVPPACLRTYTIAQLTPLLPKGALDEVIANEDGSVSGAMIPWIEGLQFMGLEKEPLRTQSKEWLGAKDGGVPADKMNLAAQLSTLVVFDAITGNWDRYSGGNVGLDATGQRVLFIDNDAAFMEGAPAKDLAANVARVEATQRFSRALVKRLRALDVAKAFGTVPGGAPLLPEGMLKTVSERIAKVLAIIDAKVAARSEDDVLYFP